MVMDSAGDRLQSEGPVESRGEDSHPVVFTIGHSNGPLANLIDLLQTYRVEVLVDTRSQPYSRVAPHFSRHSLERDLGTALIRYEFMGDRLGGRPAQTDCYVDGKIDYDIVEAKPFYQEGIRDLIEVVTACRVCLLCSEEDPIRCHRRLLIARTLERFGIRVQHIRGDGSWESEALAQLRHARISLKEAQLQLL